jgi:hypothetical protein
MTITCPDPAQGITVTSAFYGRADSVTCPHTHISDTSCSAAGATEVVGAICDGANTCSVDSSNALFGDPCFLTYKYLEVDFSCSVVTDY